MSMLQQFNCIKVRFDEELCFIQFDRAAANNTINHQLVEECHQVLDYCVDRVKVIVLEGSETVFSLGADFKEIEQQISQQGGATAFAERHNPSRLYELWSKLATGPYVTVAHVRGKVNAGGVGFVAACDLVLAHSESTFALSELLFGLIPACVLPFLIRRIGYGKANYMSLCTMQVNAEMALQWGLVDACDLQSSVLLRKHLNRLRLLSMTAIRRYKQLTHRLPLDISAAKSAAIDMNTVVFSDPDNLHHVSRYIQQGLFPWE